MRNSKTVIVYCARGERTQISAVLVHAIKWDGPVSALQRWWTRIIIHPWLRPNSINKDEIPEA